MPEFIASLDNGGLTIAIAAVVIGGIVRGFAGFGAGMIFMPVASALIDPRVAAASFLVVDSLITLPIVARSFRICQWRTVIPAAIGAALFVPLGAYALAVADILVLRWVISGIVLGLCALLATGWRYHGVPTVPVSLGVGASAGFLGGLSQISGPPVVAFWLSGPDNPAIIRANLMVFFALASIMTFVAYVTGGFFTGDVARLLLFAAPAYAVALFIGARGFGRASPRLYRSVAYGLIALAAITSLPALDGLLRR
ncbi:sulfite exporter TauE/SafE family protein [Stappia sp. F7233]|uniref:Probable membrane transporter protein n=1 Tax=Stappia albiluteola TaxID=2758565 RepID=A0A839AC25_9HYPH|nr:sulfite exporter TauE/SafE family protein [Stappia albiluteola]MBA5777270.1 sulfite exporter TauE/SafE family protein [Stappia albiluteola]